MMKLATVVGGVVACLACSDGGSSDDGGGTGGTATNTGGTSASSGSGGATTSSGGFAAGTGGASLSTGGTTGGIGTSTGGSKATGGAGNAAGGAVAGGGAGGSVDQCNDVPLGEESREFEVLSGVAPEPKGGSDLAGTYDLTRSEFFVREDIAPEDAEVCNDIAGIEAASQESFISVRLSESGDKRYSAQFVLFDPPTGTTFRSTGVLEVDASGTHLFNVEGTIECGYRNDPSGESVDHRTVVLSEYYEPNGFTVGADSFVLIDVVVKPIDPPGPPFCQIVQYYQRR